MMDSIKILYKIVENPKVLKNYEYLRDYFNQNGMQELADAFNYLIESKNVANNDSSHNKDRDN
jgi:hypothetical protein